MAKTPYKYHSVWADSLREEGRNEGSLREARKSLLVVLSKRSLGVTPVQRERIESCEDLDQLETWLANAVTAASGVDVFR